MSIHSFTACVVCGDSSETAINAMIEYSIHVPGTEVCGPCADHIANAYCKKHSGEWLTWPNENRPATTAAAKKAVIPQLLRTEVFERDMYRCLRCGGHTRLRADHVVPESKGGETSINNLQTLCHPCNSWKGVKTIDFRKGS